MVRDWIIEVTDVSPVRDLRLLMGNDYGSYFYSWSQDVNDSGLKTIVGFPQYYVCSNVGVRLWT